MGARLTEMTETVQCERLWWWWMVVDLINKRNLFNFAAVRRRGEYSRYIERLAVVGTRLVSSRLSLPHSPHTLVILSSPLTTDPGQYTTVVPQSIQHGKFSIFDDQIYTKYLLYSFDDSRQSSELRPRDKNK